jgi:hypothetical protein
MGKGATCGEHMKIRGMMRKLKLGMAKSESH